MAIMSNRSREEQEKSKLYSSPLLSFNREEYMQRSRKTESEVVVFLISSSISTQGNGTCSPATNDGGR
ncbi:uncharacterized protein G2W53_004798 [Senna tora]|uniref:Uncharacterized protein n=1 Tax=Senna tora TaxID=362788 RepID=A0A834XC90_9FABA|nr:uncharacterized protein G2W53_004798 [Senna tora]